MDLPEITQAWTADVAPYVAAMAELIDSVEAARDAAVTAIEEIQAAIDSLDGKTILIDVVTSSTGEAGDTGAAASAAAAEAAAAAADAAAGAEAKKAAASTAGAAAAGDDAAATARQAAVQQLANQIQADAAGDAARLAATEEILAAAKKSDAEATALLAAAEVAANSASENASTSLRGIISAMTAAGQGAAFFGLTWNQVHWILGVSAEALAVIIPAMIAFGAATDVASQAATDAYNHMTALWTAAESMGGAFGQTMGTVLGLKDVLQQAQNAAAPGVYELLGSAVNDVKAQFDGLRGSGTALQQQFGLLGAAGLQVISAFDEFSARITVDLKNSGSQLTGLISGMVSDLVEIGQVFGNVGHAILNFASDMPGLAEVLLKVVDALSQFILWISELPPWLITGAMALEEFYRWGGLVAEIIARIGLVLPMLAGAIPAAAVGIFTRLAGIMGSVVGVGAQLVSGLAVAAGGIAKIIPAASGAATALEDMSQGLAAAASDTMLMGGLGLVIAAMAALAYAISKVKDADDAMAASAEKAVAASSDLNVIPTIASNLVTLANATDAANQRFQATPPALHGVASNLSIAAAAGIPFAAQIQGAASLTNSFVQSLDNGTKGLGNMIGPIGTVTHGVIAMVASFTGASAAAADVGTLNAAQESLIGTFKTVNTNLSYLSATYHLSGAAAAALAQEAGVNLQKSLTGSGEAAEIARQQITNLVTGLGAMSAPVGALGNDMEALGIQSQLAGTKVSQLNSAWDAFISTVTSGMSSFSQVQSALQGMGQDAAVSSHSLSGAAGSISESGTTISYSLKGIGSTAMQSWQQFTSAISTGEQALDFLRTGMAEGVVSASSFTSSVKALVGEFTPFAAGSQAATSMLSALAQEAGGPATSNIKTLQQWAGTTGNTAATTLANGIEAATEKMSNMSTVAQNLSAVVSSDLDAALAANITKFSGVSAAVEKYSQDLSNSSTPAQVLKQDVDNISTAMTKENQMAAQAAQGVNAAGDAATAAGGHTASAGNQIQNAGNQILTAAGKAAELRNSLLAIPTNITTTVTTVFTTVGTPYTAAGAAANAILHPTGAHGGMVVPGGILRAAGGAVIPGFMPGADIVPALLSPGEGVLNPYAVRMLGGPSAVNWLNSAGERGGAGGPGAAGGAAGAAGTGEQIAVHSHVYLDGKEIFTAVQQQGLVYNTRNSGSRTGKYVPGK